LFEWEPQHEGLVIWPCIPLRIKISEAKKKFLPQDPSKNWPVCAKKNNPFKNGVVEYFESLIF
jgi:hypothetical protein